MTESADTMKPSDTFTTEDVGVWRVLIAKSTLSWTSVIALRWTDVMQTLQRVRRLFGDIYRLGPGLFAFIVLEMLWSSVKDSIFLLLSSRVLKMVCTPHCDSPRDLIGIRSPQLEMGGYNSRELYQAVGAHIVCTMLSACLDWFRLVKSRCSPISIDSEARLGSDGTRPVMKTRSRLYFQEYLMKGT
jgi:hypothetical protein